MKTPTLKQLQKRPALFWDETNSCPRITYPNGNSELPKGDEGEWCNSLFTLKAFKRGASTTTPNSWGKTHFYFIQFL